MEEERKNRRFKLRFMTPILLGACLVAGYYAGKHNTNTANNSNTILYNEYLSEYITDKSDLSKEVNDLLKQKKELQKSSVETADEYNVNELLFAEISHNDKKDICILCPASSGKPGWYYELDEKFEADYSSVYRQNLSTESIALYMFNDKGDRMMLGNTYISFSSPLISYLSKKELEIVAKNNGKVSYEFLKDFLEDTRNSYNIEKEAILRLYSN